MEQKAIPETFLPGNDIREELDARGWTQLDLADILNRPANVVSDIVTGRRPITPEIATLLARAFGTTAEFWMNLQAAYELAINETKKDDSVARRSKLYEKVPVREIQKRGWIEETKNVEILESQICRFLEIENINDAVKMEHVAKKSTNYEESPNPAQLAWLMRTKKLAQAINLKVKFSGRDFNNMIAELQSLLFEPESINEIPKILNNYGIRFLVVEHLPNTKIDGACFWLNKFSPVVVLSLRYDRIDNFWFVLLHELKHVNNRDGESSPILEIEIVGERTEPYDEKQKQEKDANEFAVQTLVNQDELNEFIVRKDSVFSKKDIIGFARRIGVHPGVVIGQLHHRHTVDFSHFRKMLIKVRDIITASAFTDGWGHTIKL